MVPIEPVLRNGAQGALSLEAYTSPRVSFRAEAGYGRSGVDREFRYEVRHLFAEVDALYHWEHGATRATRSYVGIGAGVYRYASIIPGSVANDPALRKQMIALGLDPDTTAGTHEKEFEVGANGIFGVEYLMSKSASVSLEGGYHRVGRVFAVHPYDGAFLAASLGAKFYF
ncbi:MAG: hypothetical protein LBQ09_02055 [Acidobacteriaceae bacterium]|nr:hypothetical protein [Acidobacteriaceae bacterium]